MPRRILSHTRSKDRRRVGRMGDVAARQRIRAADREDSGAPRAVEPEKKMVYQLMR